MTKHRDVNKCRRQEKYKMAALIKQANKRIRNGQEAKDKKKKRKKEHMVKMKGKKRDRKPTKTLSQKKEEAVNVSEQRDKG